MNWRQGIDRLAWYMAGVAFLAVLGEMFEDVFDDDRIGAVTSTEWAMIGGASVGGAVLVWLVIRGIGWVVAGFVGDGEASQRGEDRAHGRIEQTGQESPGP